MLTFWIALALVEWFFLSVAVYTYIRHTLPGVPLWRMMLFATLWPLTVALWTYDFAFAADMDFI